MTETKDRTCIRCGEKLYPYWPLAVDCGIHAPYCSADCRREAWEEQHAGEQ